MYIYSLHEEYMHYDGGGIISMPRAKIGTVN
jgi:hypothetical protein